MNGYWNSLRPMEKRLVVGVGTMVVILLNLWFVVPHFSDLPKVQERKAKAQRTLEMFQKEIDQKPKYVRWVAELQGAGQNVAWENQIYQFQNSIQSEVVRTGVQIQNQVKPHSQTNQFFIDQIQSVNLQAKEQQLVDFLFGLGNGPSIRVRDLTLHADPSHTMLQAAIKLVASYQKNPTAKGAPATQPPPAKSTPVEKKTTLRVNPTTPATNQAPATKPGAPPGKSPSPADKKSNPNLKKP
jgi:hypothetical protein